MTETDIVSDVMDDETEMVMRREKPEEEEEEDTIIRDTRVEQLLESWNLTFELDENLPLARVKIEDATQIRLVQDRGEHTVLRPALPGIVNQGPQLRAGLEEPAQSRKEVGIFLLQISVEDGGGT